MELLAQILFVFVLYEYFYGTKKRPYLKFPFYKLHGCVSHGSAISESWQRQCGVRPKLPPVEGTVTSCAAGGPRVMMDQECYPFCHQSWLRLPLPQINPRSFQATQLSPESFHNSQAETSHNSAGTVPLLSTNSLWPGLHHTLMLFLGPIWWLLPWARWRVAARGCFKNFQETSCQCPPAEPPGAPQQVRK